MKVPKVPLLLHITSPTIQAQSFPLSKQLKWKKDIYKIENFQTPPSLMTYCRGLVDVEFAPIMGYFQGLNLGN